MSKALRNKIKLNDTVSVKDFGAVGNGSTDDTAAINAAIDFLATQSRKRLVFPPGTYRISAPLNPLTGSNWTIQGSGIHSTFIQSTANDRIFASDARSAEIYWHQYRDFTVERVAGGTYTSSAGIVILGDVSSVTGLQYASFENIRFNNLYRGIVVQDTGKYTFGSFINNTRHGFFTFKDLVSAFASDAMYECVVFEGGTGPHHTFIGGQIRGTNAAIRLGTPGGTAGIGDITFVGLHVVVAGVGIDVHGPVEDAAYDQNITISGCQFDNCSTATVRMDRMKNFRLLPNNSTSSVGVSLTNCTNFISEDRNTLTAQSVTLQGTLNTTSSSIQDTNGTRISQDAAFRRSVNTGSLRMAGGNTTVVGGVVELFGGAHPTSPNAALIRGDRVVVRNQANNVDLIDANASTNLIRVGDGAWNGPKLSLGSYRLWVDATGDLRIKFGDPTSDTDGTVVGTQT